IAAPSKLKEYPVGITKDAMSLGTPKCSIFFITIGSTDSELAVEKASSSSFFNSLIKAKILTPQYFETSPNTIKIKKNIATITTKHNFNNGIKADKPKVMIVVVIKANTANGANNKILLIIQNTASSTPDKTFLTGCDFSPIEAKARPKKTETKMIGNKSPCAMASMMFGGIILTTVSINEFAYFVSSAVVAVCSYEEISPSGNNEGSKPSPGLKILPNKEPKKIAKLVIMTK